MGHQLKRTVAASDLAQWCGLKLIGSDFSVVSVGPLSSHGDGVLCFAKSIPNESISDSTILIAHEGAAEKAPCVLVAANPRLEFARALDLIEKNVGFSRPNADPVIHPSAQVSPHAFIALGVEIGARTVVLPFAFIGQGTRIGSDCVIKSGAVIGQDGFGFERDEAGLPLRLVHLGFVVIGNHVEVGSLTTVCRGTLGNTVIEDHAKVDDHVHVAHNVQIGVGAMVVACAELSGGVVLGRGSWIGPNSTVIQQKRIGAGALVGIGSNVLKDVPDGVTVAGNPAKVLTPVVRSTE
jgi:UDP-3-O-[3-hydroxymyristoyl] glucosamine N-acyltransferase